MRTKPKSRGALRLGACVVLSAHLAFAQESVPKGVPEPPASASPGSIRIEFRGETLGAAVRAHDTSRGTAAPVWYECHTPCVMHPRPGKLTVEFRLDGSSAFVRRTIETEQDSIVSLSEGNPSSRGTGIAVFVAGVLVGVAGLVLTGGCTEDHSSGGGGCSQIRVVIRLRQHPQ